MTDVPQDKYKNFGKPYLSDLYKQYIIISFKIQKIDHIMYNKLELNLKSELLSKYEINSKKSKDREFIEHSIDMLIQSEIMRKQNSVRKFRSASNPSLN